MKNIILGFCFVTLTTLLYSQAFTISGTVKESSSGEPIIGAKVFDTKSKKGTLSNEYGFFSLTLPKDSVYLRVSYMGLQQWNTKSMGPKILRLK